MSFLDNNPPFQAMVRASGLAEVWTHSTDSVKFNQFGWRCTNKETSYGNDTLVGNWNEERFDNRISKQAKPLPSQNNHYFESTYDSSYNVKPYEVPKELKHLKVYIHTGQCKRTGGCYNELVAAFYSTGGGVKAPHPNAFPGHQPETDSAPLKSIYNSWETTTRSGYVDPTIRQKPLAGSATTETPAGAS